MVQGLEADRARALSDQLEWLGAIGRIQPDPAGGFRVLRVSRRTDMRVAEFEPFLHHLDPLAMDVVRAMQSELVDWSIGGREQ